MLAISNGYSAPYTVYQLRGDVLPLIHGQGYIIDVVYDDKSLHSGHHLSLSDSCYGYCQLSPGIQRIAARCDFGLFEKPTMDEKIYADVIKSLNSEVKGKPVLQRVGIRPISPDILPMVGPMKMCPNVVLNVGYGPYGFASIYGSKISASIIDGEDAERFAGGKMWAAINVGRMLI